MDDLESERPFSSFGSAVPTRKGSPTKRFFLYIGAFLLFALVPLAFVGWRELWQNLLEQKRPEITLEKPPQGLGSEPLLLQIRVTDDSSGIDEVVVRGIQRGEVREIFRKRYEGKKQNNDLIQVPISREEHPFDEGDLQLSIAAFDRSFSGNPALVTIDLVVDYESPEIEVITTQHNGTLGGAQLVFYRLLEANDVFSGVTVGQWLFPGFQASALDPDYEARPDIYFAFFPIPMDFNADKDKIRLFARDKVGNFASAPIRYRVRDPKYRERQVTLEQSYLEGPVYELAQQYRDFDAKLNLKQADEVPMPGSPDEFISLFRMVNVDFRNLIENSLKEIFARPKLSRLWQGSFVRIQGSRQLSAFGVKKEFVFEGQSAGSFTATGTQLAVGRGRSATAVNTGVVVFADALGPYGKTVILDHGFGLYTLYGNLNTIAVSEGDEVLKSEAVGTPGRTGLDQEVSVHFEVRLHGMPVRPVEWLDSRWLKEHVLKRIFDTKKALGIRASLPSGGSGL